MARLARSVSICEVGIARFNGVDAAGTGDDPQAVSVVRRFLSSLPICLLSLSDRGGSAGIIGVESCKHLDTL